MRVLVACEENQRVCIAFREKGHEAYSCDMQDCSGGHPEWHIKGDILGLLNPKLTIPSFEREICFLTCDGVSHTIHGNWDMIIAFPPCTYLTNAGQCNFTRKNSDRFYRLQRLYKMYNAVLFVNSIWGCECPRIAIENPVGVLSTYFSKPTQIIHPYEYGHSVNKSTCLWLKGLPLLEPTNIGEKDTTVEWGNGNKISKWYRKTLAECGGDLEKLSQVRSKTFEGVVNAMAEQWG